MDPAPRPLRVGVSACLLGEEVRYDGGHKQDHWITGTLGRFAEFVPVCPEVEIGLGVPRPSIRLESGGDGAVRLVEPRSGEDLTRRMERFAQRRVRALEREDLDGYVLKGNSPSCGRERVKVHGRRGPPRRDGRGLFAAALMERLPLLPVEEEGRLRDPRLRENFIERLFAGRRLRDLFAGRWSRGDLVAFHAREKFLLLAHDEREARSLGRIVAGMKGRPRDAVRREYREGFAAALARPATPRRHANVLEHMAGFLREHLDAEERTGLAEAVADLRRGLVPLVVPVTLVRQHARRHGVEFLLGQTYLEPHPKELMLRNHV